MRIPTPSPELPNAPGLPFALLRPRASTWILSAVLAGCTVGPSFKQPTPETPAGWSTWHGGDASLQDPDMGANRVPVPERWWETFNDATLNALEVRAAAANPEYARPRCTSRRAAPSAGSRPPSAARKSMPMRVPSAVGRAKTMAPADSLRQLIPPKAVNWSN